jgi:hypothetical protein
VNELGGCGRCARSEIILLDQEHSDPAPGGVARDSGAIDAAADDSKIEIGHAAIPSGRFFRTIVAAAQHGPPCAPGSRGKGTPT